MTFEVRVTGFNTKVEAEAFIDWYEGQGEQDSSIWFEERHQEGEIECSEMMTELDKLTKKWKGNSIELPLRMIK